MMENRLNRWDSVNNPFFLVPIDMSGDNQGILTVVLDALMHVSTPTLKSASKIGGYVRNVVKVKCTLRVTLGHPYMGSEDTWRSL